jgi:hypothetical protein
MAQIPIDKRKVLKERLAYEIKSYCEQISEKSKWVWFEKANFDAILNDILKSIEEVL